MTRHDHAGRRGRLRELLGEAGIDLLYVIDPRNVRYLTGFTGSSGQAIVTAEGDDLLLTDHRYDGRAATEAPDLPRELTRTPIEVLLRRADGRRVGFEGGAMTYEAAMDLLSAAGEREIAVVSATGIVERLRRVKDVVEIEALRRACEVTTQAWQDLLDDVRPGATEHDLAVRLERRMVDLGADGSAFPAIVAGGPNAAIPHHEPTSRPLERGDVLKIDCGARVDGYHADMTRTAVLGEPADDLREIHALVQAAQQAGVDAAVAGATCDTVDEAARTVITDAGHGEHFTHGIGHGVGLQIHEAPILSQAASDRLEAGTAITVEPGVYLPGFLGVRIEDTIVVTADGPAERLTTAPRDLLTL